jgi:hypothetical protein
MRFTFDVERQPKNADKPEPMREQNMMKQLSQLDIVDRGVVLSNGIQQRGIRVPVVAHQIAQHLKHATC